MPSKQVHAISRCGMPMQHTSWWSVIQVFPSSHVFECAPVRLAAAQRLRVSSVAASAVAIDPNSHRVVDTELRDEAEKSYLAVRRMCSVLRLGMILLSRCLSIVRTFCLPCSTPCQSLWGGLCRTCVTA